MIKLSTWLAVVLGLIYIVVVVAPATAAAPPKVFVNGQQIYFDAQPIIKEGVTLIPVRGLFESMGATVTWDQETKSIFISNNESAIALQIAKRTASVNGENKQMLRSPEIIGGRTMIPLRFISESLGAKVTWDSVKNQILIETNAPKLSPNGNPVDEIAIPPIGSTTKFLEK